MSGGAALEAAATGFLLEFFEKLAGGAGDIDSAGDAALAVLHALDDARLFATLGAVGRFGRVHYFFAISGFCYFCHDSFPWPEGLEERLGHQF